MNFDDAFRIGPILSIMASNVTVLHHFFLLKCEALSLKLMRGCPKVGAIGVSYGIYIHPYRCMFICMVTCMSLSVCVYACLYLPFKCLSEVIITLVNVSDLKGTKSVVDWWAEHEYDHKLVF